jgi:hypothetical protein
MTVLSLHRLLGSSGRVKAHQGNPDQGPFLGEALAQFQTGPYDIDQCGGATGASGIPWPGAGPHGSAEWVPCTS